MVTVQITRKEWKMIKELRDKPTSTSSAKPTKRKLEKEEEPTPDVTKQPEDDEGLIFKLDL
jgi:hypothetical protein